MFTPDASGKRRRAGSARRSMGPGTPRGGTPAASRRSMTPRAASVSAMGSDDAPQTSARSTRTAHNPEQEQRILVRNEALTIDIWADLPVEVQDIIHHSDLYTSAFRSSVRHDLGYACIVSRESCWVWSINRRHHAATAFTFPCPPLSSSMATPASSFFTPTPYVALLPTAKGREPALLLVAPGGAIRLWQAVSMGLSGPQRFNNAHLDLQADEVIKDLVVVSRSHIILSTSASRIIRLTIQSVGGQLIAKPSPAIVDLRAPAGYLSRWITLPNWSSSGVVSATDGVFSLAVASALDAGRQLAWALEKNALSCLSIAQDDPEQVVGHVAGVSNLLLAHLGEVQDASQIHLHDVTVDMDGNIILLASSTPSGGLAVYYLVAMSSNASVLQSGQKLELDVLHARRMGYSAPPDMRPLSSPTVKLLGGGPIAVVTFVDVLVVTSTSLRSALDETIPLKANAGQETRNRFFSTDELPSSSPLLPGTDCIAVSAASGLLRIRLTEVAKALQDEPLALVGGSDEVEMMSVRQASTVGRLSVASGMGEGVRRQTSRLRARLEQAVYYGEEKENPLAFDAAIDDGGGDVGKAALEVSEGLLTSSSELMVNIIDMRNQLATREARMHTLLSILHQRGLFGKITQNDRRKLSWNAEKLAAASALWTSYNTYLSTVTPGSASLLLAAVEELQREAGKIESEDPIRDFLREQVTNMDDLIHACVALARGSEAHGPQVLVEAANCVMTIYAAINRFRETELKTGLYGVDPAQTSPDLPEPWTARAAFADDLPWLFDSVRARWSTLRNEADRQDVVGSLADALDGLSDYTLQAVAERTEYLRSSRRDPIALRTLRERYEGLRPAVIRSIVKLGRPGRAYELAEAFEDFRLLVELSTDDQHGSDAQLQFFIEKYGADFAFPLYHYYIEKGQVRKVMEQNEVYGDLVLDFLRNEAKAPRLEWLQDVATQRYTAAASTLLTIGPQAKLIAEQRTMLSISKLAYLATLPSRAELQIVETQKDLEAFDDRLDFAQAQLIQRDEVLEVLKACKLPPSPTIDAQAVAATEVMADTLDDRLAFSMLYQRFVRDFLRGVALSGEEMIDFYTLTSTPPEAPKCIQALQIFVRQKQDLPTKRAHMALQSIWRRIYLATDWISFRRDAAGASDDAIAAFLRDTPLFSVLNWIGQPVHRPLFEHLVQIPSAAGFTASRATLEERFKTSSGQELDVLIQDYEHEASLVAEYRADGRLDEWFGEASRLVQEGLQGMGEM